MTEHALADAAIMGTRTDAESKLCALVDQWNELRKPLMAPAKEHKRRDIAEHEVRFQIANAAALLAWHLRRPASPTVAAGDVAAAAIRVADATLCQWAPPGDCGRDGQPCLCEEAARAVLAALPRPEADEGVVAVTDAMVEAALVEWLDCTAEFIEPTVTPVMHERMRQAISAALAAAQEES